ncbi:MAG: hypothetical protein IT348_18505 [Candidatus Eisenbacteria bacterium]|nr:hypothetical protein [Candidatus Eisenbacteria bacterium]
MLARSRVARWPLLATIIALSSLTAAFPTPAAAEPSHPLLMRAGLEPREFSDELPSALRQHYFYKGLPYGSDALVHPARLVLNGGFGILQFDDHENRLGRLRYSNGARRVWAELSRPGDAIAVAGWNDFIRRELLPVSTSRAGAQYWPNYTLHLVGGGMSHRMMTEWFEAHGSEHAARDAGLTLTAYHLLNEVVEAEGRTSPSTDAIADVLVFDPAGVALFSRPSVARFFGEKLNMRDWSSQPAIDPATGAIENQGQNFSIKVPLPGSDRWSALYYFGNHGELGLTYTRPNGSAFSLGGGLRAKSLVELGAGSQTATLVPSYGFFYDRDGSLMLSVTAANTSRYRLRINAYPGRVRVRGWTTGLFLLAGRDGETLFGLHAVPLPMGLAARL